MELPKFVTDRLSSPLAGPFTISWCLWNWRALIIAFTAGMNSSEKIASIEIAVTPLGGLILPLISSAAYIFLMPLATVKFGEFVNYYNRKALLRDERHELIMRMQREYH